VAKWDPQNNSLVEITIGGALMSYDYTIQNTQIDGFRKLHYEIKLFRNVTSVT
jgi:hypothetical protein